MIDLQEWLDWFKFILFEVLFIVVAAFPFMWTWNHGLYNVWPLFTQPIDWVQSFAMLLAAWIFRLATKPLEIHTGA